MTINQFRMRLVKQALLQKKGKALLIVLAVAMGASVVTALLNLEVDLRERMNRELRDYGPNVLLVPAGSAESIDPEILNVLRGNELKSKIISYTPQTYVTASIDQQPVMIISGDLSALSKLYPAWHWKGVSPDRGKVYAGRRLAERIGLHPNTNVSLNLDGQVHRIKLDGTVEGGEAEDDQMIMSFDTLKSIGGTDRLHLISISALGDLPEVERSFSSAIQNYPNVSFQIIRKIAAAETQILDKISQLMSLVISIIFVILFFCIYTTVSAILLSRQHEIALLRVIGARRKQIMSGLTLELLVLALVGGLFGFVAGVGMAEVLGKILFQTYVVPRAGIFLITVTCSLAMVVISSILPIQRAINRQAAIVLKEA